jgi:hypothetical protein
MEDVVIPVSQMLPGVEGLKGPFGCLNNGVFPTLHLLQLYYVLYLILCAVL